MVVGPAVMVMASPVVNGRIGRCLSQRRCFWLLQPGNTRLQWTPTVWFGAGEGKNVRVYVEFWAIIAGFARFFAFVERFFGVY